jgi:hypothetical protein
MARNDNSVTHYIDTVWNDGENTRYAWKRKDGKPTRANLLKVCSGQLANFATCTLVHADTTVITTVTGS